MGMHAWSYLGKSILACNPGILGRDGSPIEQKCWMEHGSAKETQHLQHNSGTLAQNSGIHLEVLPTLHPLQATQQQQQHLCSVHCPRTLTQTLSSMC
jgi:hypothetical protein